ncbi:MAG: MFS transporter, partial [Ktedonobacteraceae bacterium]
MITVARGIAQLPPTSALFAAFLGYNPMAQLLAPHVLHALPVAHQATLLGHSFFPNLISPPFLQGLRGAFYLSAALCLIAACVSLLRGKRYVYGQKSLPGD